MNILPYTLAVLLLLSLMTYDTVKKYYETTAIQNTYLTSMEEVIRGKANSTTEALYNNSGKGESGDDAEKGPQHKNGKINIAHLFTSVEEDEDQEKTLTRRLFKQLMYDMFHNKPFFQEMDQLSTNLLDTIITTLATRGENYQLTKTIHLSNIDFENEELQTLFYRMTTMHSADGTTLYDHLTFSHNTAGDKKKLWIYYAHPEIIRALACGDKAAASYFIEQRTDLAREIARRRRKKENWNNIKNEAQQRLRDITSTLLSGHGMDDYGSILDFTIQQSVKPPS